jgi:hypothetical protein
MLQTLDDRAILGQSCKRGYYTLGLLWTTTDASGVRPRTNRVLITDACPWYYADDASASSGGQQPTVATLTGWILILAAAAQGHWDLAA